MTTNGRRQRSTDRIKYKKKDTRLQEVSNQVKLAIDRELANLMGHLMCEGAQMRVRLNGTEGEEASGGDDNYQLSMTRYKEKVARETLVNKDAQLKVVMAEVNIRMNAEAMGKAIITKEVRKA